MAGSPDGVAAPEAGARRFVRIALGFWRGETRKIAWFLSFALLACILLNLGAAIAVNRWNKYFFDALQAKDASLIGTALALIVGLALFSATAGVLQLQARMRLQLRWRQWLTDRILSRWLAERRFYQLSVLGLVDNPEARVAEDGRLAVELFVDFAAGVLNAALAAASFVGVLWFVGGALNIGGYTIPGYMVIAVVIYTSLTTLGMYLLGKPLVERVEAKAGAEADFRFAMTHTREHAENIALIGGDEDEKARLNESFAEVARRWISVIGGQARMMFLSGGNNVIAPVVPLLLGAPKFMAGEMSLGDLMQAAAAFAQVQMALNWLADNSLRLADWFASARRVASLDKAFEDLDAFVGETRDNAIDLEFSDDGALHLEGLSIAHHDGRVMLGEAEARIEKGEKVMVKGDSGTGKSTLIRAIAGLWPWGSGVIRRPRDATTAFMPQRPYIPIGTLRDTLNYPATEKPATDERIADMLRECGLDHLVDRLGDSENWASILSGGEQQRFAFARVALLKPDIVIMDEPTSALDEVSQRKMMELMGRDLPEAMILHVAHRPGLEPYHDRELHLTRQAKGPAEMSERARPAVLDKVGTWVKRTLGKGA